MPEQMTVDLPPARSTIKNNMPWVVLWLSLAALAGSPWVSDWALILCILCGWLFAMAGLYASIVRLASRSTGKAPACLGLILAALLLIAHTMAAQRTGRVYGWLLDGRPVTIASMKSLHTVIQQYTRNQGIYPASLTVLADGEQGLVHPKGLISPLDPGCDYLYSYNDWPAGLVYSSYIYQAGKGPWLNDSRIVLAFEYDAWQPMDLRLLPEYGRFVLFGDERVELLDPPNFNRVLREDAARRQELGWPRQFSRPVGELPRAPATAPAIHRHITMIRATHIGAQDKPMPTLVFLPGSPPGAKGGAENPIDRTIVLPSELLNSFAAELSEDAKHIEKNAGVVETGTYRFEESDGSESILDFVSPPKLTRQVLGELLKRLDGMPDPHKVIASLLRRIP